MRAAPWPCRRRARQGSYPRCRCTRPRPLSEPRLTRVSSRTRPAWEPACPSEVRAECGLPNPPKASGMCTSTASCIPSCVLPTPGTPANSAAEQAGGQPSDACAQPGHGLAGRASRVSLCSRRHHPRHRPHRTARTRHAHFPGWTIPWSSCEAGRSTHPSAARQGVDNWLAISTGADSARTEIIHESHVRATPCAPCSRARIARGRRRRPHLPTIAPRAAQPEGANSDDGNGQALRVGDYKLIFEKGPQWHGPPKRVSVII